MSLGWRSAGLCLAAAFPPRAAVGSRFHLLPSDSSCCPEALLSGAAPSSSVEKGCSGNYFGLQERHQSLGPVCQGELSMWLNFFADQKHPCRFWTRAAAAFFCPVPIWIFFCFFRQNVYWDCWKSCLWQRWGMLLAKWEQNWFTWRERSRKLCAMRSLSNSTLALSLWQGNGVPSAVRLPSFTALWPILAKSRLYCHGRVTASEGMPLAQGMPLAHRGLDAAGAVGMFALLHSGH